VKTQTIRKTITYVYTTTEVIPVTKTVEAEVTIPVTVESGNTVTEHPTILVTKTGTVYQTVSQPPIAASTSKATTTPAQVTGNTAHPNYKAPPALAILAGIFGAIIMT
jgi:hypothetical protein